MIKLFFIFATLVGFSNLKAEVFTVSWKGTIDRVDTFGSSLAPEGVVSGGLITGNMTFDTTAYARSTVILGNYSSGNYYNYTDHLDSTFQVGELNWEFSGGMITLSKITDQDRQVIDLFSTSENSQSSSFPNYEGPYESGIALWEDGEPLSLFDNNYQMPQTIIDFSHVTGGAGSISTRIFDENQNLVSGYYVWFNIDEVSATIIPEPSAWTSISLGGMMILWLARRSRARRALAQQ